MVRPAGPHIVGTQQRRGRSYNAYRKLQKLAYPNIRQALVADWKEAGFPLVSEK